MNAIEHVHAEVASLQFNGSSDKRLTAASTGLAHQFGRFLCHLGMRLLNVVDAPVSDGGRIGRLRRKTRRIEAEWHDLWLLVLSESRFDERQVVKVSAKDRLRCRVRGSADQVTN